MRANFSTSTSFERVAFDVTCMDAFQGYFEYEFRMGCGIPQFILEGEVADWESIVTRTRHLSEYGLGEWTEALVPVLERIVQSAKGDEDPEFWRSFFRYQAASGPAELTGWIHTLFPYLDLEGDDAPLAPSPYLSSWREHWNNAESRPDSRGLWEHPEGPSIGCIPPSLVSAPVTAIDVMTEQVTQLRFVAGMFGVTQNHETGRLAPSFGWAVVYD